MTAATEMAVYTETVQDAVADLFTKYAAVGDQDVLTDLIQVAEVLDQPLCSAATCWTPHDLTYRSCCDQWVCEDDGPEHDRTCTEFEAQLREDTF